MDDLTLKGYLIAILLAFVILIVFVILNGTGYWHNETKTVIPENLKVNTVEATAISTQSLMVADRPFLPSEFSPAFLDSNAPLARATYSIGVNPSVLVQLNELIIQIKSLRIHFMEQLQDDENIELYLTGFDSVSASYIGPDGFSRNPSLMGTVLINVLYDYYFFALVLARYLPNVNITSSSRPLVFMSVCVSYGGFMRGLVYNPSFQHEMYIYLDSIKTQFTRRLSDEEGLNLNIFDVLQENDWSDEQRPTPFVVTATTFPLSPIDNPVAVFRA